MLAALAASLGCAAADPGRGGVQELAAWPKAPYRVFFSRVRRPAAVKVDGRDVPFRFAGNVMAVDMSPCGRPVTLALHACPGS